MIDIEALAAPAFLARVKPDGTLTGLELNAAARSVPSLTHCLFVGSEQEGSHTLKEQRPLAALLQHHGIPSTIGDIAVMSAEIDGSAAWWASLAPVTDGAGQITAFLGLCRCGTSQSEAHLSLALQAIHGAEWRFDVATGEYHGSGEIAMLLGEKAPRAISWAEWLERVHPEDSNVFVGQPAPDGETEFRFRTVDGELRWGRCSRVALRNEGGQVEAVLGIILDITPERVRETALVELASRDPLTGLLNRRGLRHEIDRLRVNLPTSSCVALLVVDLDHFKLTNDRHGHAAGDAVLTEAARRITKMAEGAICARLGGDEFVAVLPVTDHAQAVHLQERVTRTFRRPLAYRGQWLPVSATVGIACVSNAIDVGTVLERADADLYVRKHSRAGRSASAA